MVTSNEKSQSNPEIGMQADSLEAAEASQVSGSDAGKDHRSDPDRGEHLRPAEHQRPQGRQSPDRAVPQGLRLVATCLSRPGRAFRRRHVRLPSGLRTHREHRPTAVAAW